MHSPFCPNLADLSACAPPALQNGPRENFILCNFESHKYFQNKLSNQNVLHFFFLLATLANLGEGHTVHYEHLDGVLISQFTLNDLIDL